MKKSSNRALVYLGDARKAVERAKTVQELKTIRDKAEAVRQYAKQAGESLAIQNHCAEIKIRAERKAGELLEELKKQEKLKHGGDRKSKFHDGTLKLADLGVDRKDSHRWQREASVPDAQFERWVAKTNEDGAELTSAALLKVAAERERKRKIQERESKGRREAGDPSVLKRLEDGHGCYRCVYADPPWEYQDATARGVAAKHYSTLSPERLQALSVSGLAHKDGCHFWIWTTWPKIRDGVIHAVLSAWELSWVGEIVWNKLSIGTGRHLRGQTEVLVLAASGEPVLSRRDQAGYFEAARTRKHSEKPGEFRQLIESLSPGPRIELFARVSAEGWDRWGLEA